MLQVVKYIFNILIGGYMGLSTGTLKKIAKEICFAESDGVLGGKIYIGTIRVNSYIIIEDKIRVSFSVKTTNSKVNYKIDLSSDYDEAPDDIYKRFIEELPSHLLYMFKILGINDINSCSNHYYKPTGSNSKYVLDNSTVSFSTPNIDAVMRLQAPLIIPPLRLLTT